MPIRNLDQFLKELPKSIEETRRYLTERSIGKKGPGTVEQLEGLLEYLERIEKNVRMDRIPSPEKRDRESIGWILVDGWDPKDPLGKEILELDHYYLKKLP
jgi:hypothetical protein